MVPPAARTARFVAAIALSLPDGTLIETEGNVEGAIADAPRGTHGFGYDPIFLVGDTGRTLAELADDEKNGISHRARALAVLRPRLIAALPRLEG
jgi:XTP/dITP diphosphohydrolase